MDNKSSNVDIKSLRIGSHIDFNGRRVKIKAIVEGSVAFDYTQDEKQLYLSPNACDEFLLPIPITPELLKELGFENGRVGIWWHWWKDGFHLQHRDESEYWHFHGDIGLRYFHELESLYYMIYETELIQD